jgi:hypothetical protein
VHRMRMFMAVGLWLAPLLGLAAHGSELGVADPGTGVVPQPVVVAKPLPKAKPAGTCDPNGKTTCSATGDYGTTVHFVDTPKIAAEQAAKEEKLVFVLHVSGDFEDPRFT